MPAGKHSFSDCSYTNRGHDGEHANCVTCTLLVPCVAGSCSSSQCLHQVLALHLNMRCDRALPCMQPWRPRSSVSLLRTCLTLHGTPPHLPDIAWNPTAMMGQGIKETWSYGFHQPRP